MKKILPVFLILFSFSVVSGQVVFKTGYVILKTGDTLKGEIKTNAKKEFDLYSKVFVKISETEKKSFTPAKIKEFKVDERTFVSKEHEGELVFMKKVSDGALTLLEHQYEWQSGNQVVYKSDYFFQKSEQDIERVKSGKFRKQVQEYMNDCEKIVKEMEENKYEFEQIIDVVEQYNTWHKTQSKG